MEVGEYKQAPPTHQGVAKSFPNRGLSQRPVGNRSICIYISKG